jgi:hypothetical protein
MTYYEAKKEQKEREAYIICRVVLNDFENWGEDKFSMSDLEFRTGRSQGTIRRIMDAELPKRGFEFFYEASPEMCTPDLDEEIQIPDQHIRVYLHLVRGAKQ